MLFCSIVHFIEVLKVGHVVIVILTFLKVLRELFLVVVLTFFSILAIILWLLVLWVILNLLIRESLFVDLGMFFEPFAQSIEGAAVSRDTLLVTFGVEGECREAFNLNLFVLVGGCIVLGNDEVLNVLNVLSELVPVGGKTLAVAAPRSIVLHKHILGRVHNNVLE